MSTRWSSVAAPGSLPDSSDDREDRSDPLPAAGAKIGALDQAAPLAGWELPDGFSLRRLLEARIRPASGNTSRSLGFMELRSGGASAMKNALRLQVRLGYDAVNHLVLCIDRRPPKLDLDIYPCLPRSQRGDRRPSLFEACWVRRVMTERKWLAHHLKTLKLPTFARSTSCQCATRAPTMCGIGTPDRVGTSTVSAAWSSGGSDMSRFPAVK